MLAGVNPEIAIPVWPHQQHFGLMPDSVPPTPQDRLDTRPHPIDNCGLIIGHLANHMEHTKTGRTSSLSNVRNISMNQLIL